jgi:uncharacterized membrane protein
MSRLRLYAKAAVICSVATLSQAKTLGGIGSILIFIPFVSVIGFILMIVAVKDIADDLQDKAVFNNIVIAAVTGIVGALAGAFVIVFGAVGGILTGGLSAFFGIITGLLVVWVFLIVSAVFLKRAYDTMGQRLGVHTFNTAATLYLAGAVLTIVFVGFLLLFVAEILQAVAFFSIPDQRPRQAAGGAPGPMGAPLAMPALSGATKFCTTCGSKIAASATFCNNCGGKQP